jgi:hypothetical protein
MARRIDLYLYSTQHSQERELHVSGGIRTRSPNKRAAADPRDFTSVPVKILPRIIDFYNTDNLATYRLFLPAGV